jgi:UDP-glucose 4-epimerase
MKVLVTGGAGFIGTNLVKALQGAGHQPSVLDDFSTGLSSNVAGLGVEIFEGSLEDLKLVERAARGVDAIAHLGARGSVPRSLKNPLATHSVNATGTLNVMEAARTHGAQVIFSSSSSVYGSNEELPKNEKMWTSPMTPYAASKLAGEGYVEAYQSSYGVPVSAFRFFNVFGPWQRPDHDYAAVIPKWIWKAMNNQSIEVFGDGTQSRDFTYVGTVVKVLLDALENKKTWHGPLNLAFGNRITLNETIDILQKQFPSLDVKYIEQRKGDVLHSQSNPEMLRQVFPNVTPVNFEVALLETINWLKSHSGSIVGGPKVLD